MRYTTSIVQRTFQLNAFDATEDKSMYRRRDKTILWWIGVNSDRKQQQQLQKLLLELMLYILINSCGHVGTFAPFYGTSAQQRDVLTRHVK